MVNHIKTHRQRTECREGLPEFIFEIDQKQPSLACSCRTAIACFSLCDPLDTTSRSVRSPAQLKHCDRTEQSDGYRGPVGKVPDIFCQGTEDIEHV